MSRQYDTIIFDLGDVLFHWDASTITALPKLTLRHMMHSTLWYNFERGLLSSNEAYKLLAEEHKTTPELVRLALDQAQETLTPDPKMSDLILKLKATSPLEKPGHPKIRVLGLTNITKEHFESIQASHPHFPWHMFDRIFTSFGTGMRKPNLNIYQHVLDQTGIDPARTIFLDDRPENICSARFFGIRGEIVGRLPPERSKVIKLVTNLLVPQEVSLRAMELVNLCWPPLPSNGAIDTAASDTISNPDSGVGQDEPSSKEDSSAATSSFPEGLWYYFATSPVFSTKNFPRDSDTTSLAYLTVGDEYISSGGMLPVAEAMDAIARNVNEDGILLTYFDQSRPMIDSGVCADVLRFFNRFSGIRVEDDGRLKPTVEFVVNTLANRAYIHGTRYYTPEAFLYFAAHLWSESKETSPGLWARLDKHIRPALIERLRVADPVEKNALALAMRVYACQVVGIEKELLRSDFEELLSMQEDDGGWPAGCLCFFARSGDRIGNRGLTTALVWKILKEMS